MTKSKVFLLLCSSFLLGIIGGEVVSKMVVLGMMILATILISLFWRDKRLVLVGFLILSFSFGGLRFQEAKPQYQRQTINPLAKKIEETINKTLPEPQSSFLAGLLLGLRREMPLELLADFSRTGTIHIIALSGYNVTIIAVMLAWFFGALSFPRFFSFWFSVAAIIFFLWLTGWQVSLIRASIMGLLVLLAGHAGRLYSSVNALVFAAALMALASPFILLHSIGFQLSFLATSGIIFTHSLFRRFGEILGATLSAQIMVFPLIAYYFSSFSLISPLANILILPVIPVTMLFGFLSALFGFLFLPLAQVFSAPAWLFLTYIIKVVNYLSRISISSIDLPGFHWLWLLIVYAILVTWILKRRLFSWRVFWR